MDNQIMKQHSAYLEPPEDKVWGYDWRGQEIYFGDAYYEIEGDYVGEDDIDEYLKEAYLTTSLKIAGE